MGKDKKEKSFVHKIDDAVETTGKAVGGVGGGLTGAASGAVIGTVICPGIGTAIGAAAGAIGGTAGGAALGKLTGKVVTGVRKVGSGAIRTVTGQDKKNPKSQDDQAQLIQRASAPAIEASKNEPEAFRYMYNYQQPATAPPQNATTVPYPVAADPGAPPPYSQYDQLSAPPPYPADSGSNLYPSLQ
ncbi:unnamed protein product [Oikopleura dioica]|uniref:Glycine zipper domain-containing protein n=1 Tax=Oikopleura dioica TaxID=34765 RepID=E4WUA4_OIKDI|nr:unnamed protein product [Oikopleura dioica]